MQEAVPRKRAVGLVKQPEKHVAATPLDAGGGGLISRSSNLGDEMGGTLILILVMTLSFIPDGTRVMSKIPMRI